MTDDEEIYDILLTGLAPEHGGVWFAEPFNMHEYVARGYADAITEKHPYACMPTTRFAIANQGRELLAHEWLQCLPAKGSETAGLLLCTRDFPPYALWLNKCITIKNKGLETRLLTIRKAVSNGSLSPEMSMLIEQTANVDELQKLLT